MTLNSEVIHVGKALLQKRGLCYLVLRQVDGTKYSWFERQNDGAEIDTGVFGTNVEEALREANRSFKDCSFRMVNCGFRYTLPERDEHGINALFREMAASQKNMNGIYFDEEVGHNCYVQFASDEALNLLQKLKS